MGSGAARGRPNRRHYVVSNYDSTTVQTHPNARGIEFPQDAGEYNTSFAHGRVLAIGFAHNAPHSKIVRADLERLAAEISG